MTDTTTDTQAEGPPPFSQATLEAEIAKNLEQMHGPSRGETSEEIVHDDPEVESGQEDTLGETLGGLSDLDPGGVETHDQDEHSSGDEPNVALERATTALDKAGLGPELREGMNPEQVIAMGKAVAARQAEQQRETQRIVEERNRLAAAAGDTGSEEGTPEAAEQVRELLAKQFPDEEVAALSEALDLIGKNNAAAKQEAGFQLAEAQIIRVRQEMATADSALSQDEVWSPLIAEANALLGIPGRYDGADDPIKAAFEDAAKLAGRGRASTVPTRGDAPQRPDKRSKTKPATTMKRDELNAEILRRRRAGQSLGDIRSWMERG